MSSKHGGHFIFKNPKKYGQGVKAYTFNWFKRQDV